MTARSKSWFRSARSAARRVPLVAHPAEAAAASAAAIRRAVQRQRRESGRLATRDDLGASRDGELKHLIGQSGVLLEIGEHEGGTPALSVAGRESADLQRLA